MKKVLLGATALTAAGAFAVTATPALAEFDLKISGWNNNAFIYSDTSAEGVPAGTTAAENTDANASGLSMYNSSEINFYATQKLDNGLTIVSRIELESSANGSANSDETQVHVNGGFGQIQLGGIDTANDAMHYGPPTASLMGLSATSYRTYMGITGTPSGHFNTSWNLGADDSLGLAYYTPRIAGFQAGASYSPNATATDAAGNSSTGGNGVGAYDGDANNAMAAGLNFQTEMQGIGFNASVGAGSIQQTGTKTQSTVHGGVKMSYMGFGVGFAMASYAGGTDTNTGVGAINGTTWEAGIKYGQGPWSISYGYMDSTTTPNGATAGLGDDIETSMHEVAGNYNLGPGVNLGAAIAVSSHDRNGNGNIGTSNFAATDGLLGITSLTVSF